MNASGIHLRHYLRLAAFALVFCAIAAPAHAEAGPQWAISTYRIRVLLLLDLPPAARELLDITLPRHLQQRATAAIGALWKLEIVTPQGNEAYRIRQAFDDFPKELLATLTTDCDKLVLLAISTDGMSYQLRCRAFDTFVHRWAATLNSEAATLAAVPEMAFWALRETFAPVAYFQTNPKDDQQVTLAWKGSALPGNRSAAEWISPGDILVPIMRRVDRDGNLVEGSAEQVPWTYLQAADGEAPSATARIWSHTKRPFNVRRRGSGAVDNNAILVRGASAPVIVRLESRISENSPLAGFDIYRQIPGEEATTWVGKSNLQGEVMVPAEKLPLELIYVKSGSQLLAKLPITFSADNQIKVPLVDDPVRLEADAKVSAIREELIDLVARRHIFAHRIRGMIKAKDLKQAESLLNQLDELPGRAQFDQMLAKQEQLSRSSNPMVQKRIDKLFADTRVVLGHFLDVKLATELRTELSQAKK